MKKLLMKVIIGAVIAIVVAVVIRFALRGVLTGERIGKITEKVTERVAEKVAEKAEKATVEKAEVTGEKAEAPVKKVSSGKMNDDIWVEIFAYTQYRTAKYVEEGGKIKIPADAAQYAEKYAKDIENIYKKFGVTQDNFSAYTDKLGEKPQHYAKLVEKAAKQVEELKKAKK